MTPRRPTSSQSGTRRVSRGARPRQVPTERAASSPGSGSGASEPEGLPTTAPERVLPPRIVTLAVVCLLAFVVVFTSLRAYLSQQAQYDAVVAKIKEASDTSTALEDELAQWKDDTYVRAQVRERLGYVMPGDTSYVVVGADTVKQPAPAARPPRTPRTSPGTRRYASPRRPPARAGVGPTAPRRTAPRQTRAVRPSTPPRRACPPVRPARHRRSRPRPRRARFPPRRRRRPREPDPRASGDRAGY